MTVHRLRAPQQLRKKMIAGTRAIESAFSIVERVSKNLKRWHDGGQRERSIGSPLWVVEKRFRWIMSCIQTPALTKAKHGAAKSGVAKKAQRVVQRFRRALLLPRAAFALCRVTGSL